MTAAALLDHARSMGIVLEARGPKLHYLAPAGLPDDLRAALVEHKAEVLAALVESSPAPAPRPERWPDYTAADCDPALLDPTASVDANLVRACVEEYRRFTGGVG